MLSPGQCVYEFKPTIQPPLGSEGRIVGLWPPLLPVRGCVPATGLGLAAANVRAVLCGAVEFRPLQVERSYGAGRIGPHYLIARAMLLRAGLCLVGLDRARLRGRREHGGAERDRDNESLHVLNPPRKNVRPDVDPIRVRS